VFVATTNQGKLQRTITYHPYNDGTGQSVLHSTAN